MHVPIEWLPARGHAEQMILLLHGRGQGRAGAAMAPRALQQRLGVGAPVTAQGA